MMDDEKSVSLKQILEEASKKTKADFDEIRKNNPHHGDAGAEAEDILKSFLKERMPRRFDAEGGFVVGLDEKISLQTDVIVFDALNCPVYRRTKQSLIVPRNNVAAVIEVKSKLSKEELKDAAKKIASVKQLKAAPIGGLDQPVNFANLVNTNVLGCVFAYESATSLDTLADNLKEINSQISSDHWIDMVVVLDKGIISYVVQFPMAQKFPGWFGGALANDFVVPPIYVHLVTENSQQLALNHFYVRLMAHLSLYRQLSAVSFSAVLGDNQKEAKTIQGYQYNLDKKLVPAEALHQKGSFQNPKVRYNLYNRNDGILLGQICLWPWQEGAAVTYSGRLDPVRMYAWLSRDLKVKLSFFLDISGEGALFCSNVTAITEDEFRKAVETLPDQLIWRRDTADNNPIPTKVALNGKD